MFDTKHEPLYYQLQPITRTVDTQETVYGTRWRGVLVVYDSERSPRDPQPQPVQEGCCPNLVFESRFESGNLRQARRVGQYEYELVLKTDLYTNRHTQWYYFRVKNAVPGVTYKFRIVNLLKRDSLYNYGMRPLMYSEYNAQNNVGWMRTGHHISYSRNMQHLQCPLLQRGIAYYYLEWQMEFPQSGDVCYLAHCYPYTFTDLKDDLDSMLQDPAREMHARREVLCETRAGNSCFLITVTNFGKSNLKKKVAVVTARVHPGESQASWMMRGLLDFVTSEDPLAEKIRNSFILKIVPMLNPDGVIVGNYRCSLAARDLNRNYRHPRRESFPTIWYVKNMVEALQQRHEVVLYCDLHGHSRKHNVFMYGNNTSSEEDVSQFGAARTFINERLFPWLMSQKAPNMFSYPSCKFHIRKCKESTGRVVMWRQMRILNSFTLEATFSGTTLNSKQCRHFNISDFMSMGRTLGEVILDYHDLQQNKARQTEVVLDLTRVITQDILASRGLIPPDTKIPNLSDLAMLKQDSNLSELDADTIQEDAEKWTGAILSLVAKDREKSNLEDRQREKGRRDDKRDVKGGKNGESNKQPSLTRKEVNQMIDNISLKTMDGCLNILTELNVREAIVESDSSDSDSESEPEMKESKTRKKKRKSKKQRDRDKKTPTPADKKDEPRMKSLSASLPALVCVPESHPSYKLPPGASLSPHNNANPLYRARQANVTLDKYMRMTRPHYISKYEGRSNGGVPCFTEERSIERQAKRMAEIKKKHEEDRQKDLSFFFVDGRTDLSSRAEGQSPLTSPDDINRRLQVALNDGTSNISQALVGFNIKTGYTHADNLRDMSPVTSNSNGFVLPPASLSSALTNSHVTGPFNGNMTNGHKDISSSDESDSDGGDIVRPMHTIPVSSRRNPYQLDHMPHSLTFPVPPPVFRKPVRTGPVLKSVHRHVVTSTPSLITSGIIPRRASVASSELSNQKLDDQTRLSRSSGPLMRSLRHNGVPQGFN